jgi:hypothetical protein
VGFADRLGLLRNNFNFFGVYDSAGVQIDYVWLSSVRKFGVVALE